MKTKIVTRKSMIIRPSNRSTDFIAPSFINECAYNCSYCYVKRHNAQYITIAKNTLDILTEIDHHVWFADVKKPNQTGDFITYDIGCNSDIALHAKQLDWKTIFAFFRDHPLAMGSFATKYVNKDLLQFDPHEKIRIRFSLMPEEYRQVLEPNTNTIYDRLIAVEKFIDAGYEVHLNFSPVIVHTDWLDKYKGLFEVVKYIAKSYAWDNDAVKAEVIFLTHNKDKHEYNKKNGIMGEEILWSPSIQEPKTSEFGGRNIRYKAGCKSKYIEEFRTLHDSILPWNTIRYIF